MSSNFSKTATKNEWTILDMQHYLQARFHNRHLLAFLWGPTCKRQGENTKTRVA